MSKAKSPDVRSIRLLVLDVDGVLTDGTVLLDGSGGEGLERGLQTMQRAELVLQSWLRLELEQ